MAQRLKCLPPMRETQVQSLGQEDPLEKEMVTHSVAKSRTRLNDFTSLQAQCNSSLTFQTLLSSDYEDNFLNLILF